MINKQKRQELKKVFIPSIVQKKGNITRIEKWKFDHRSDWLHDSLNTWIVCINRWFLKQIIVI